MKVVHIGKDLFPAKRVQSVERQAKDVVISFYDTDELLRLKWPSEALAEQKMRIIREQMRGKV